MRMWSLALVVAAVVGCGKVIEEPPPGGGPGADGPACAGTTVEACGAACVACPAGGDREVPTCDGTACGTACRNTALTCSDNSCVQTQWTFESGSMDGITSSGFVPSIRDLNGRRALAIEVPNLVEFQVRIPVCLSGTVDVRQKTFSLQAFFQGGSSGGPQYYLQGSLPSPQNGAYLGQIGVASQVWTPYTAALSGSQFSSTCTTITMQVGTYGAAFTGTIWFDDIKVE